MSSEAAAIRGFVREQLRGQPDLSSLTVGILKRRYLAHVGCESLSPSAKCLMKQVIEEELMKMQEDDNNGSEPETKMTQNKRKRDRESDTLKSESEGEAESRSKKSRRHLNSSSESQDKEDRRTRSEGSEAEEQNKSECGDEEVTESHTTNVDIDQRVKSSDASDEETNEEKSSNTSKGIKSDESDQEDECDADTKPNEGDTCNSSESADSEKEEKQRVNKEPDTLSVSPLDDDQENTKKKVTVKKKENGGGGNASKEDHKTVLRLKRYISLCGVRRNYKKLLDGCRTVRSMVATLKKELEDLGVEGQPTIKKCQKVRKKREEDQELAALDVSNIIVTQGRSKRRGVSARQEQHDAPASVYQRSVNSGSDSDQENKAHRGRQRVTNWANLRGIISDDGDSD